MASKAEKTALGLPENASDEEILARIGNLVAAEQLLEHSQTSTAPRVRLALLSLTGQDRYRGTYIIQPDTSNPLVLDLEDALAETANVDGQTVNVGQKRISLEGAEAVIPCNPTRKQPIPYDFEAYKVRNTIERCFNKLKHFRRIATRFDRRASYFLGFLQLATALLWMR